MEIRGKITGHGPPMSPERLHKITKAVQDFHHAIIIMSQTLRPQPFNSIQFNFPPLLPSLSSQTLPPATPRRLIKL